MVYGGPTVNVEKAWAPCAHSRFSIACPWCLLGASENDRDRLAALNSEHYNQLSKTQLDRDTLAAENAALRSELAAGAQVTAQQTDLARQAEVECMALREKLAAAEAAMRWRPMESAPKDGTKVILWRGGGSLPIEGQWNVKHGYWENRDGLCSPMLWMPLPPAPGGER